MDHLYRGNKLTGELFSQVLSLEVGDSLNVLLFPVCEPKASPVELSGILVSLRYHQYPTSLLA